MAEAAEQTTQTQGRMEVAAETWKMCHSSEDQHKGEPLDPPQGHQNTRHGDYRGQQLLPGGCPKDGTDILSKAREVRRTAPGAEGRCHPFPQHKEDRLRYAFHPGATLQKATSRAYLRSILRGDMNLEFD